MADVRRILADVERRGIDVEHWEVRSPTLDDVFLTLTGRPRAEPRPRRLPGVLMTTLTTCTHRPSAGPRTTRPR